MTSVSYPSGSGNGGNGTQVDFTYDSLSRRVASSTAKYSSTTLTSDAVTYSQSGRIVDETIDGTDPYTSGNNFTYDAAGRLTGARVPSHNLTYTFSTTSCSGTNINNNAYKNTNRSVAADNGTTTATYCYDNADRLVSVGTDSRYNSIAYDAHGNTTTLGSDTMTYDISDRHLTTTTGSTTVTYTRDATDRIISRTDGTNVTHYSYSGAGDSPSVILDSANTTILDKTLPLLGGTSMDVRGGTTTWNYSNIHGDVTAQANSSGTKVGSTTNYDPFGQPLNTTQDTATGNFDYSWLGSKTRLTEHEGSLNTIEMGARQYVAGLGRFIEVDPVEGGSANDYDYCDGDAVGCLDLNGQLSCKSWAFRYMPWCSAKAILSTIRAYRDWATSTAKKYGKGDDGRVNAMRHTMFAMALAYTWSTDFVWTILGSHEWKWYLPNYGKTCRRDTIADMHNNAIAVQIGHGMFQRSGVTYARLESMASQLMRLGLLDTGGGSAQGC